MKAVKQVEQKVLAIAQDTEHAIFCKMVVNGKITKFLVDTGFPVSIIPFAIFQKTYNDVKLLLSNVSLFSYTKDAIPVRGIF